MLHTIQQDLKQMFWHLLLGGVVMYRYGEDFFEESDVKELLAQYLQKKQESKVVEQETKLGAEETVHKKNLNLDYLFDR